MKNKIYIAMDKYLEPFRFTIKKKIDRTKHEGKTFSKIILI